MPDLDFVNETPEETAAIESIRTETPVADTPAPKPIEKPAELAKPAEEQKPAAEKPKAEERVRLVPHAALHEERVKRQELERRLREIETAKPKAEPVAELDEHTDPIGVIGQLKAKLQGYEQQTQRQMEEARAMEDLGRRVGARVQAYAAEHPEYSDQVKFLRQSRFEELQDLGYEDEQIARQLLQEEVALGQRALETDRDPGEMVASMAKRRGWKAADPNPEPNPAPEVKPAPQAVAIKEEIAKTEAKIARLEKGQRAARSPSTGGGGAAENELSLAAIADLDGAAFDAAFKNVKALML